MNQIGRSTVLDLGIPMVLGKPPARLSPGQPKKVLHILWLFLLDIKLFFSSIQLTLKGNSYQISQTGKGEPMAKR
jgi:hypothetical protein